MNPSLTDGSLMKMKMKMMMSPSESSVRREEKEMEDRQTNRKLQQHQFLLSFYPPVKPDVIQLKNSAPWWLWWPQWVEPSQDYIGILDPQRQEVSTITNQPTSTVGRAEAGNTAGVICTHRYVAMATSPHGPRCWNEVLGIRLRSVWMGLVRAGSHDAPQVFLATVQVCVQDQTRKTWRTTQSYSYRVTATSSVTAISFVTGTLIELCSYSYVVTA